MNAFFRDLGDSILARWKRENFALAPFPEIARSALDERPPATHVDLPGLIRDFLLADDQPRQTDSDFGEPELVVFSHPRFYIQLLFWMDGTTAIHQHAFSGAFHVLLGSSIHAHYTFENPRPVTPQLHLGDVVMQRMELLERGRTVPIMSGAETIHSLFHLDSPSITVVVRTQHDHGTGPQFNYLPPHVAIDPLRSDLLAFRRFQLLDVLEQAEDPGYAEVVHDMLADLDFESAFHLLQHCRPSLLQLGEWETAMSVFARKHGDLSSGIEATLKEQDRRSLIKGMRGDITEPEHRFFLALLMNAPTRGDLLALVAQRYPAEPPEAVVQRWAAELVEASDERVTLLDAAFPDALGVDPELQPDLFIAAFGHFLTRARKVPATLRDLSPADLKALRAAFKESTLGMLTE